MSAHLGVWLSPLADGQLPPAQAERALAHVAVCARCASGLAAERAARQALAAATEVSVAADLTERLMALSSTVPPAAGDPLRERPAPAWPVAGDTTVALTGPLAGDVVGSRRGLRRWLGA
ncbi:zf-HC2 domain-containing protein [Xylanimonas protaetiae]|uniref:Zf-HC2 domain-containing protein n=1 Tax=Xylanimonas protaetiae TaxID=2509457 RepID=A0A4P6F451_9MICO|nr:zf-HC2 domain-containing protein [Xylanimonas protaetiae]QAY70334.1 zf-HC2 domain-containing protein [Xylanimonas protaetiae]